jgi:hypothetical protein
MNILLHFIINIILASPFNLTITQIIFVGLGGILIDVDHILYQFFVVKNKTPKQMWKWHKQEYKILRNHLFIFHNIEFTILLMAIAYPINFYFFLFSIGMFLHLIQDILNHIAQIPNPHQRVYLNI